jgi:hypothetical protein
MWRLESETRYNALSLGRGKELGHRCVTWHDEVALASVADNLNAGKVRNPRVAINIDRESTLV